MLLGGGGGLGYRNKNVCNAKRAYLETKPLTYIRTYRGNTRPFAVIIISNKYTARTRAYDNKAAVN